MTTVYRTINGWTHRYTKRVFATREWAEWHFNLIMKRRREWVR